MADDTHDDTGSGDDGVAEPGAHPAVDPVDALVAAGDHPRAASLAAARGDLRRAIAIYERLWRFADALPLAIQAGDRPLAIRLALDVGDPATASRMAEEIPRDAAAELSAAADAFAARGNHWEAARMAERAADIPRAAEHFRRAGSWLDLGRMEELAGRPRQAGIAYEQALAAATGADDSAAARLALGRLLARLGRHHEAARSLQKAMRHPALRLVAGRALTGQLLALGMRVAASEIARRLRREWPGLPAAPEELAELDAADAAASASPVGQVAAATPGLLRHRFRIVRALGAGATSHVYLAEDTLLGHPVALKLLSVGAGSVRGAERQAYLRFIREAEAAGRLRHPNIVALYDADPALGLFVLEMMPDGTLADRLAERGALPPVAVRRLALDLLSALGAAHDAGIVHRDVKPANILFDAGGNAKLADFGAAHLVDFGQTQTGGLMGTLSYMSPEQISGGTIGPAADLYALAVTLFEALAGRPPFTGPDIVGQHLGEEPPPPSTIARQGRTSTSGPRAGVDTRVSGVTAAHDAVLLRALRKAPSERWRSAAHMAEAIRAWPTDVNPAWTSRARTPEPGSPAPPAPLDITDSGDDRETRDGDGDGVESGQSEAQVGGAPPTFLGHTDAGDLFRWDDPAFGRPVLREVRHTPVADAALDQLRALASVGGPHVQRVLALSDDGRTITYEQCDGPPVPDVAAMDASAAAALATARAALDDAGVPPPRGGWIALLTPGGPVLAVVRTNADPQVT